MDRMTDLFYFLPLVDAIVLPLIGLWALLATKLTIGDALRRAERWFIVALVFISFVTLRTVAYLDEAWLIHMMTLASMVMGTFLMPSRAGAVTI